MRSEERTAAARRTFGEHGSHLPSRDGPQCGLILVPRRPPSVVIGLQYGKDFAPCIAHSNQMYFPPAAKHCPFNRP